MTRAEQFIKDQKRAIFEMGALTKRLAASMPNRPVFLRETFDARIDDDGSLVCDGRLYPQDGLAFSAWLNEMYS